MLDNIVSLEKTIRKYNQLKEIALKEIQSWGNLNFPIISKSNRKYAIDFSTRVPSFPLSPISIEVFFNKITEDKIVIDIQDVTKVYINSPEKYIDKGLFVKDLNMSLSSEDDFVKENFFKFMKPNDSLFISFAYLYMVGGFLVYIPKNISPSGGIVIKRDFSKPTQGAFYSMVFVDEDTNTEIIEYTRSDSNIPSSIQELSEIVVSKGCNIHYNIFQNLSDNCDYFVSRKVLNQGKNNFEFNSISLGASYVREDNSIDIVGQDVELKYTGIYYKKGNQKYDLIVNAKHKNLRQGADIIVKGILDEKAKVYFNGILKVEKNLTHINSFLGGHALHLSPECKSDSIPSLEIESFDVKSGHAASLTQLDPEKLFYIRTRGLSEDDAKKIIVQGFIEGAIGRITSKEIQKIVKTHIKNKGLDLIEIYD